MKREKTENLRRQSARPLFRLPQWERGNKAFTLAEVLITLVIIGVIGALTVPALIQNTQKQEYVSALKKAYSTLSNAAQQIIAEEGTPKCNDGGWACSNPDVYNEFKKRLNIVKDCAGSGQCFGSKYYNFDKTYYINDDITWRASYGDYRSFVLADGISVSFGGLDKSCSADNNFYNSYSYGVCAFIAVDVNGAKAPNIKGRDAFAFVLKENGLFPAGCDSSGTSPSRCPGNDHTCACKVLTEGAMNY